MTKLKSKKMTKSTFAVIIMAIAMVALLAFGGTYAYFTATATDVASENLKTGYVKLSTNATAESTFVSTVLPGEKLMKEDITYTVDTTDENGNYVFVKITLTSSVAEVNAKLAEINLSELNLGTGWKASTDEAGVYYQESAIDDNGTAVVSKDALTLPNLTDNWTQGEATSDGKLMDAEITITFTAKSIQSTGTGEVATLATTIFD